MAKLNAQAENKNQINIEISEGQVIFLTERQQGKPASAPAQAAECIGMFLNRQDGRLVFGISADRKNGFADKQGGIVSVTFVAMKTRYSFGAEILGVREASEKESLAIGEISGGFDADGEYDKYIIEIVPTTALEKKQMREFFRMPLEIDIYYSPVEEREIEDVKNGVIKFALVPAEDAKKDAEGENLEEIKGYLGLRTMDMSAGGFRCSTVTKFKEGVMLNCMLIVGYEALPAMAQVLNVKPDGENPGMYDIRAIFYKMSDPVRDRVVKYMFHRQRQFQARFFKKNF